MLWSMIGTLLPCAELWDRQKVVPRCRWQRPPELWTKPKDSQVCCDHHGAWLEHTVPHSLGCRHRKKWWCLGSFRHSPCPVLLLALIGVLGQGLPAGAVPVRTVGLPSTWQEPALREDTYSRGQTPLPLGSLPSQILRAFDNHVKASQIQLTLSSQARAPQIRANSYLSSEGDKRVFKKPPQKTREDNQLLFHIYFIFSLNKRLLFFFLPTMKLIDLFIKFSKFRHQTDVFLPLLILFLAALT